MKLAFFVFFSGSVLGFVYHLIERAKLLDHETHKTLYIQHALDVASIGWMLYAYRCSSSDGFQVLSRPGFLWTIFLFIMLVSNSEVNLIKIYLENSAILQSFGKYSFGVYLLHPMVIFLFMKNDFIVRSRKNLRTCELYGLVVLISYILGVFWYHFLEKNCIKSANKICQKLMEFFHDKISKTIVLI